MTYLFIWADDKYLTIINVSETLEMARQRIIENNTTPDDIKEFVNNNPPKFVSPMNVSVTITIRTTVG